MLIGDVHPGAHAGMARLDTLDLYRLRGGSIRDLLADIAVASLAQAGLGKYQGVVAVAAVFFEIRVGGPALKRQARFGFSAEGAGTDPQAPGLPDREGQTQNQDQCEYE